MLLDKSIRTYEFIDEKSVGYPKQHMDTYTATKAKAERLVLAANNPSPGNSLFTESVIIMYTSFSTYC